MTEVCRVPGAGRKPTLETPPKTCGARSPVHGRADKPEKADRLGAMPEGVPDRSVRDASFADNAAMLYDFDD